MARKEILDRIEKYVDPFRITKGKGKFPRRKFLHFATVAAAFPSLVGNASASDYPVRPVHIVVPSLPVGRPTLSRGSSVNGRRSDSANNISSITGRVPPLMPSQISCGA